MQPLLLNINRPRKPVRGLKMRTKADDQGVICSTYDDNVKTVCLNTVVVDNVIYRVIEKEEFLAYKSGALQRKFDHASGSEDDSSLFYFGGQP